MAVFHGPELEDWRVKVVNGADPKAKIAQARAFVADWIARYEPTVLAVKRLHPSRGSPALRQLATAIETVSRRRLRTLRYSIQQLEAALAPGERINKRRLAELVAAMYPALAHELVREQTNRNPYHIRAFEAVALGAACYQQLNNQ